MSSINLAENLFVKGENSFEKAENNSELIEALISDGR